MDLNYSDSVYYFKWSKQNSTNEYFDEYDDQVSTSSSYEDISRSFRTESIKKCTLIFGNARREETQRVMAAKLTRLTHKIAIQLHLVAQSCTICSSHSRQPVRKHLDTPSYVTIISLT
jgi:hypothetical protein